jgi:formylglycine-generating enzyme required for sulfatase activity
VDADATRGIVRRSLNELAAALDPDQGTLFFYFSGHGFQQEDRNYLATFGSTVDDLKGEGLAVSDIESILRSSRTRQSMMFIDACRNNPAAGARSAGTRTFASLGAAQGLRALYSTRSGQVSYESDELQQGVFTYFMIRGMRGEAAGGDGLVTFRDLADYVTAQVRGYGVKAGQLQVPYEAGESSGDFLVARGSINPPPMPAALPEAAPAPPLGTIDRGPRPGQIKVNARDGQRYVWIPPGKFTMGCSPDDNVCGGEEEPAHEVNITKGFWLGQTPVTVGGWKRYRQTTSKPALPTSDTLGRTNLNEASGNEAMPAVAMTWSEAQSFCEWSAGRLPTEAEWEYAARAGATTARYGDLQTIAWYGDNSGRRRIDSAEIYRTDQSNYGKRLFDNGNGPHPAGQKRPNAWNLYDMLGNVSQWTADWYDAQYYARRDSQDPLGPPTGQQRTLRGGSWLVFPRHVRVSSRGKYAPEVRDPSVGLRCLGN